MPAYTLPGLATSFRLSVTYTILSLPQTKARLLLRWWGRAGFGLPRGPQSLGSLLCSFTGSELPCCYGTNTILCYAVLPGSLSVAEVVIESCEVTYMLRIMQFQFGERRI
ncbi:hypothetical protein F4782DRAFT_504881 [Xylaria castorea]|nr:hypothetical protein F4782DRAFT_504881 [Xylaria castorea]